MRLFKRVIISGLLGLVIGAAAGLLTSDFGWTARRQAHCLALCWAWASARAWMPTARPAPRLCSIISMARAACVRLAMI